MNDERNADGRRLAAIEARIDPVVLDVMFAEAEPVIAEFKRLAAAAGEAAWKVVTLKALSIELAHAAEGEVRGELFARMPSFVEFVQGIYPPPSIDDFDGMRQRSKWLALASRLRAGDVDAKFAMEA